MTISEAEKVADIIRSKVSSDARIIWGAAVDPTLENRIRVMVVITGVSSKQILGRQPGSNRLSDTEVDIVK
jgi:cell division protein FtsZ